MKKITMFMFVCLISITSIFATGGGCLDWNEYVDFKNTGGTDYYLLTKGCAEKAAQTYHYSGPGNITDVKIMGQTPNGPGWSHTTYLKVGIYNVDANNRPTSLIDSKLIAWYWWYTEMTAHFAYGGVPVSNNFAVSVELVNPCFIGQEFKVKYTGDGDGGEEDLPSIAGACVGANWLSLLPTKDGDFYIIPQMNHYITANFTPSATCGVAKYQTVDFTNTTLMTTDKMFNTITLSGYTGSETLYDWDFGDGGTSTSTNPSHSYAAAGVYTVTLTSTIDKWPMGGSFCSDTKTMKISVGLDVTGTPTNLACYGDQSGSIQLTASGGDNTWYKYSLNGTSWQSSSTFTGLSAGTYTIYVKDAMCCEKQGTSVTITQPNQIVIGSPVNITLASCGNADGAMLVSATGGTGTLTYSIDGSTYQSSGSFNGLTGGTYTLYVQDANGCMKTKSVVVGNTVSPTLTLQSYTNVSCKGGNDGTITIFGSGGTGTLQYSIDGATFQSSGNFTNISAGSYAPSVRDAAGCIGTLACITVCGVTITEPEVITFSLSQLPATCNGNSDGEIDVEAAIGGIGTLTYSVDGVNFQSGSHFEGLAGGLYTVSVKDIAECSATDTITVVQPNAIIASIVSSSNLTCNLSQDGTLSVTATGGDGNYSFSIDGINYYPAGDFNSLAAGTYTVYVKDGNNCKGTTTVTITFTQPTAIIANITTGNSTCGNANGTLLTIAGGGSGAGYSYSIDGGATGNGTGAFSGLVDSTYVVLVTDGNGCQNVFTAIVTDSDGPVIANSTFTDVTCNGGDDGTITITSVTGGTGTIIYSVDGGAFQLSNQITGLAAGQHTVVVRDANGCTGEISASLAEPSAFTILLTPINIGCYGNNSGGITVSAAGGAGTLAYSIDGINFQSPNTFTNLAAGTYNVTVRDAGGCTDSETTTITQPSAIVLSIGTLNVDCNGNNSGAIYASAVGGTGVIQYSINGVTYQSSGIFTNLTAGNYTVFASDASSCVKAYNTVISQPNDLVLSAIVKDVSCAGGNDGVIDIAITGGTPPYKFSWPEGKTSEDIFNLVAGIYTVYVTDANACTVTGVFTVSEPLFPIITNGVVVDATGATTPNGSIDATVNGGTPPYAYQWNHGPVSEDISGLLPGVYVLVVTDNKGCTFTTGFVVEYSVGLEDLSIQNELRIYPNPAKDIINVNLGVNQLADRITLISITGQVIYEATPKSNNFELNVKFYDKGLYFINIYIGEEIITKKVVINR